MPHLVAIYGPPLAGKTTLARAVAAGLGEKTAVVSPDAILQEAIRVHATDAFLEMDLVHTQTRLLVANFMKFRYHVVLEGAFYYEVDGILHRHEQEIDQTLALMRNMAPAPLIVRLSAPEETLRERAAASARAREIETILRIEGAYKARYGSRFLHLQAGEESPEELAQRVLDRLTPG